MITIITSHGFNFAVQGDGFGRRPEDFDSGVEAIQSHLDAMDAREISAMHYADAAWQDRDCDGEVSPLIAELERIGHAAATKGWHRPHVALFYVSAAK